VLISDEEFSLKYGCRYRKLNAALSWGILFIINSCGKTVPDIRVKKKSIAENDRLKENMAIPQVFVRNKYASWRWNKSVERPSRKAE
jgi:hypothetical protein